ncbi:MAG: hypothetical protein ACR2NZ_08305 [Rubripirellula sp.]
MSLVELNWKPSQRQLRQFASICLIAIPAVAWLWGASGTPLAIAGLAGGVIAVVGWISPNWIKPLFLLLSLIAIPIGWVIGELAMLLIYFAVFLPFGLIFRLINRDALHRGLDHDSKTYWTPKKQPSSVASYYRQS